MFQKFSLVWHRAIIVRQSLRIIIQTDILSFVVLIQTDTFIFVVLIQDNIYIFVVLVCCIFQSVLLICFTCQSSRRLEIKFYIFCQENIFDCRTCSTGICIHWKCQLYWLKCPLHLYTSMMRMLICIISGKGKIMSELQMMKPILRISVILAHFDILQVVSCFHKGQTSFDEASRSTFTTFQEKQFF